MTTTEIDFEPVAREIKPPEGTLSIARARKLVPYTTAHDENGITAAKLSTTMPTRIGRLIDRVILSENTPYKTRTDFIRDAISKWLDVVYEWALSGNYTDLSLLEFERGQAKLSRKQKHLKDSFEHVQTVIQTIARHVTEGTELSVSEAIELLQQQYALITILEPTESYWKDKHVRHLFSVDGTRKLLGYLQGHPGYQTQRWVVELGRWYGEMQEPVRVAI
ncbi:MAG: hypothetical protein AB7Q01_08525 [Gammaproteobacteria bacterium]